jgi:hypothetical protein
MSKKATKAQQDHYAATRDNFNDWLQKHEAKETKLHEAFVDALLDEILFLKHLDCHNSAEFVRQVMIRCDFTIGCIDEIEAEIQQEIKTETMDKISTELKHEAKLHSD